MAQLIKHDGQTPAQARITIKQSGAQPRAARRGTIAAPPLPPAAPSVDDAAAIDALTRQFGTKVEVRRQGSGGYLRIDFYDDEQLNELIQGLMSGESA